MWCVVFWGPKVLEATGPAHRGRFPDSSVGGASPSEGEGRGFKPHSGFKKERLVRL